MVFGTNRGWMTGPRAGERLRIIRIRIGLGLRPLDHGLHGNGGLAGGGVHIKVLEGERGAGADDGASEGVSTPERVGGVIVIGKNLTRRRRYNRLNYNNTATKTDNAARLHFIDQVQKTICAFLISPSAGCLD